MIAKVIVDLPTVETDQSFDYVIPEKWIDVIQPGMRVVVPFGPRKIQGFVVELTEHASYPKVRPIAEVLDVSPVLTKEMLALGEVLADELLAVRNTVYQLMLPAALRTKVRKEMILLTDELDELPHELRSFFSNKKRIDFNFVAEGDNHLLKAVKKALEDGVVEVDYIVKERGRAKTERYIQLKEDDGNRAPIPSRAAKQLQLYEYLVQMETPQLLSSVLQQLQTTTQTANELVKKEYAEIIEREVYRDPHEGKEMMQSTPLSLTKQQEEALMPIIRTFDEEKYRTFLLQGVTGSGKTEVYLQAIAHVLQAGKEAIVLVPEIALTPQMVERFKARFGSKVAVMHSALSMGEKYDEWRKIRRKEVQVVVGARSAIFAPFTNLGIIIIDEEHESTYKQEETPRYHAKDVAIHRAKHYHIPVVLGSATPSLESFARAKKGVYELLPLTERVQNRAMPSVEIVDMREELQRGNRSMFSVSLLEKLKERLERKEQSVLFLNRRGYSTFVICRDCGYVETCPHCDISLTYHRSSHSLKCHYCGFEKKMPSHCDSCRSEQIRFFGTGTQKVEEELTKVLPDIRIIRMDVDTTRRKGAHEQLLSKFGRGEADLLLGTQMIAKGLDFPNITLVGVLAADSMLHLPDFRSAERTFQLLEQVSGRAGRHELEGEVVIQSYTPDHYSIELVKEHRYDLFFQREMAYRKLGSYPPYVYLTLINLSHIDLTKVITAAEKVCTFLRSELSEQSIVLGPVASPLSRIKDRYRYQCMIKYKNEPNLHTVLRKLQSHFQREIKQGQLQMTIDLNPYMFS